MRGEYDYNLLYMWEIVKNYKENVAYIYNGLIFKQRKMKL